METRGDFSGIASFISRRSTRHRLADSSVVSVRITAQASSTSGDMAIIAMTSAGSTYSSAVASTSASKPVETSTTMPPIIR